MSWLNVKGFGGLELNGKGLSIHSFPTHHVEELLGYLLLNQNKICSREELIELLWPYDVTENRRGCLSTVLWRLRCIFRQLGFSASSFIQATRDQIVFAPPEPLHFDVECFEQQLDIAWSTKEDAAKLEMLIRAIDLYQGDLYAGIYVDWCLIERESLARKYQQALGDLLHCFIRENEFAEAIEIGRKILKIDPMREEVHRALVYCYGQLGNRAEAAAQFHLCADYLMTELQVPPLPDTVRIYQKIMAGGTNVNLPLPNSALVERANRAHAEFLRSSIKLNRILDEIESSISATIS